MGQGGWRWGVVLSLLQAKIHKSYLIPVADPIILLIERATLPSETLEGQVSAGMNPDRTKPTTDSDPVGRPSPTSGFAGFRRGEVQNPPFRALYAAHSQSQKLLSLASLFPSSRHVFVCDRSK